MFRRYTDLYRLPLLIAAALLLLVGLARITFLRILPG